MEEPYGRLVRGKFNEGIKILALTYDTRGRFFTMLPNWKVSAMSELTPRVMRAGSAFVSIQKAIQEMKTDKYVGMYA